MGFSKTPYEMQREQQERAIKAQEQAYGRQAAMQAWSALADMDTVTPEAPLAPTHDWQRSADLAAKHAAAMELQTLEGKQKREQIADTGAQHRLSTAYEYATRAKFAPKRTGGGYPIDSLTKKIWETHTSDVSDENQAKRKNQAVEGYLTQMKRYGAAGRQRAQDIENTIRTGGNIYDYEGFSKRASAEEMLRRKQEQAVKDAEARAEKAERDQQLRADIALINALEPKLGVTITEEQEKTREAALKRLQGYSQKQQTSTDRAAAPATNLPAKTPSAGQSSSGLPADAEEISPGVFYSPSTDKSYRTR